MNLYRISQTENTGYDTYSAAVVAAETEEEARHMHPYDQEVTAWFKLIFYPDWFRKNRYPWAWCLPEFVTVELVGEAVPGTKAGVICASFNAG